MKRIAVFAVFAVFVAISVSSWAGNDEALAAFKMGDYANALREWQHMAEQGDAKAQTNLGVMYYNGDGVPKSYADALKWYTKAAAQGYARAQTSLGWMYERGEGVPRSYEEARKWYAKAAEQGEVNAQTNLGGMYSLGEGVQQNSAEAVKWYTKAAEQGNINAQANLGLLYETGMGNVAQDNAEAIKWYAKAAAQGDVKSQAKIKILHPAESTNAINAGFDESSRIKYPTLVVPGVPEDAIGAFLISWPLGISDSESSEQQLVSPKVVSKITVYNENKISNEYFLDKKGRIIQEISHYSSGGGSNVKYSYDSAGNLASKKFIPGNETYEYRYAKRDDGLFERDEFDKQKGKTAEQIIFDSEGRVVQYREDDDKFSYDGGRVVEVTSRVTPGMVCFSQCRPYVLTFEYPRDGVVVAYPQSNPNERSTIMFTKDFIDAMIYYDHKSYETETNITFDSNGNWVEKRVRTVKDINGRPGNNISTTKRKIAYR